ncbi:hypothetical protein ACFE04_010494 [Oxalis oulophora]
MPVDVLVILRLNSAEVEQRAYVIDSVRSFLTQPLTTSYWNSSSYHRRNLTTVKATTQSSTANQSPGDIHNYGEPTRKLDENGKIMPNQVVWARWRRFWG